MDTMHVYKDISSGFPKLTTCASLYSSDYDLHGIIAKQMVLIPPNDSEDQSQRRILQKYVVLSTAICFSKVIPVQ